MARKEIRAEISGTVISILARKGEVVAEGDTLAFIEAMKMEIPVVSPFAGQISEVRFSEGELVTEDALIAVVEI